MAKLEKISESVLLMAIAETRTVIIFVVAAERWPRLVLDGFITHKKKLKFFSQSCFYWNNCCIFAAYLQK